MEEKGGAGAGEKHFTASKINIIQGILALLTVLSDPGFGSLNIIPLEMLPKIVWSANALTFVIRTFFSGSKLTLRFDRGRVIEQG